MPHALTVDAVASALSVASVAAVRNQEEQSDVVAKARELLERLAEPGTLVEVSVELLGLDDDQAAYLQKIPVALQEALRATVVAAVADGKAVHVQYSPGYDFELRLWDYGQAVSVHLSGPYGDRPAS